MRRIALIVASLAAITLAGTSCKKDKGPSESTKPSISWEANSSFSQQQINDALDATVSVSVPEGIKELTLKFTSVNASMLGEIYKHIGIQSNWTGANASKPVLDLVADTKAVEYVVRELKMAPQNTSFNGAVSTVLNFKPLVSALMLDWPSVEVVEILLSVTDKENRSVSKTLSFKYTPAPDIKWSVDSPIAIAGATNLTSTVTAYGVIQSMLLTIDSPVADVINYFNIHGTVSGSSVTLDLSATGTAAASNIAEDFGIKASDIVGKEKVTLNLAKIVSNISRRIGASTSASITKLTVSATDANTKTTTSTIELTYTPAQ